MIVKRTCPDCKREYYSKDLASMWRCICGFRLMPRLNKKTRSEA